MDFLSILARRLGSSFRPPAPETGLSEGGSAPAARLKAAPHLSSLGTRRQPTSVVPFKGAFFFPKIKVRKNDEKHKLGSKLENCWFETFEETSEGGPKVILHGLW